MKFQMLRKASRVEDIKGAFVMREWRGEMKSHYISLLFLCLDKFYNNMNEIKSNSNKKKLLLLSKVLIHHT